MAGIVDKNFLTYCWLELECIFTAGHFLIWIADQWNFFTFHNNMAQCLTLQYDTMPYTTIRYNAFHNSTVQCLSQHLSTPNVQVLGQLSILTHEKMKNVYG